MSGLILIIKNVFWKLFWAHIFFGIAGFLIFPTIVSFLIQKQNVIYFLASSPIIGKYSIWGFCFLICMIFFVMIRQIYNNF